MATQNKTKNSLIHKHTHTAFIASQIPHGAMTHAHAKHTNHKIDLKFSLHTCNY